jgi:inhibitor of KinA
MKIEPLGDAAYLLRELDRPAFEVAASLNDARVPGLREAVASYETVGLYVDPNIFDLDRLDLGSLPTASIAVAKSLRIPVCYELGDDIAEVGERLDLSREELIRHHSERTYRCFAVGFCPGFAYLGYLDDAISGLARKATPRVRVEPGSVAITGRQTAVYPLVRPGGWWIVGRTPLTLVDVADGYFPIEAGDEVTFYAITQGEFDRRRGERL